MKRLAAIALLPLALAAFAPQPPDDEKQQSSSEIVGFVSRQLLEKRCWTDHSDMPEARRLRTTFRIWLGPDGKFSLPPQLIDPAVEPTNDEQMRLFIAHARRALNVCNRLGWELPQGAAELLRDNYIDLQFVPKIG